MSLGRSALAGSGRASAAGGVSSARCSRGGADHKAAAVHTPGPSTARKSGTAAARFILFQNMLFSTPCARAAIVPELPPADAAALFQRVSAIGTPAEAYSAKSIA